MALTKLMSFGILPTIFEPKNNSFRIHDQNARTPSTWSVYLGDDAFKGCPLGDLTVESGANFECRCADLANRLRLNGIVVTGGPSFIIQTT